MSNPLPFDKLRLFKVLRWSANGQSDGISESDKSDCEEVFTLDAADVVSSQFRSRSRAPWHMVAIDLDVPAALIPSSTPGHSHLFIDARMSWDAYETLLDAMATAGILEAGYVGASKARGFTAVRLPWIRK